MLIPLDRARELLGAEGDRLSDSEVSQLCRELEDYARLLNRRCERKLESRQVERQEQGVA